MSSTVLTEAMPMVFVPTAKADEAKQFYMETLGLQFRSDDGFALLFTIHKNLNMRLQRVGAFNPQPFTVFGWQVAAIEDAVEELFTRGVIFEQFGFPSQDSQGICTFPNGDKVAWFKDPDGNTLSLAQLVGA